MAPRWFSKLADLFRRVRSNPHVRSNASDFMKEKWSDLVKAVLDQEKREALVEWFRTRISGFSNNSRARPVHPQEEISDDAEDDLEVGNPFSA